MNIQVKELRQTNAKKANKKHWRQPLCDWFQFELTIRNIFSGFVIQW
jgi:hypothetical protein